MATPMATHRGKLHPERCEHPAGRTITPPTSIKPCVCVCHIMSEPFNTQHRHCLQQHPDLPVPLAELDVTPLVAVALTKATPLLAVVRDVNVTLVWEGPSSSAAVLQMLLSCGENVIGTSVATNNVSLRAHEAAAHTMTVVQHDTI
jgi:hypothetical protein